MESFQGAYQKVIDIESLSQIVTTIRPDGGYVLNNKDFGKENCHYEIDLDGNKFLCVQRGGILYPEKPTKLGDFTTKGNNGQTQALTDLLDPRVQLMAISGHAGTGKTFIALLGAMKMKMDILYTREIVQVGEEMGFLPGEVEDKFDPFTRPFKDNIEKLISQYSGNRNKLRESIELVPLQFLRGSTIDDKFIIVDEAQNCQLSTLKMAISRAGENTKVILCGSFNQVDNEKAISKEQGLSVTDFEKVIRAFEGQELFSHIHLTENRRSELSRLADELL